MDKETQKHIDEKFDELASMVQRGFQENDKRFESIERKLEEHDTRFNRIENLLLLREQTNRIEKLEDDMRQIKTKVGE